MVTQRPVRRPFVPAVLGSSATEMSWTRSALPLIAASGLAVAVLTLWPRGPSAERAQPRANPVSPVPPSTIDDVGAREARLRARLDARPPLPPVARNPFHFRRPPSAPLPRPSVQPARPALGTRTLDALPPPLSLAGIAEERGPENAERTAIISAPDGVYLVRAGQRFSGRYEVVAVEKEAVRLRDLASQTAFTLRLR